MYLIPHLRPCHRSYAAFFLGHKYTKGWQVISTVLSPASGKELSLAGAQLAEAIGRVECKLRRFLLDRSQWVVRRLIRHHFVYVWTVIGWLVVLLLHMMCRSVFGYVWISRRGKI